MTIRRVPRCVWLAAWLMACTFGLALCGRAATPRSQGLLAIQYVLHLDRPTTHLIKVEIDVSAVHGPTLDFVMPAWAPGRYAIYNFAKNVQQFAALGAEGKLLPWRTMDKETWRVDTRTAGGKVKVHYTVFANDLTGSFSQFDSSHAAINGAGVYMYIAGHKAEPVTLRVVPPEEKSGPWPIYSGFSLSPSQEDFHAPDYDQLIDTPMEISPYCLQAQFQDHGKLFRVVVHAYGEGSERPSQWIARLTAALHKIVDSEMTMMPAPDFKAYTFLFHVTPFIREGDGMEHLNSTDIIIPGTPGPDTLSEACEVAAHEFFHVWNVKRLRPVGLGPFDYRHEVYSRSLWFAEGITNYYEYRTLLRAGLWSRLDFFTHLAADIRQLQSEPGRRLMSAEQSSFDAWYYDRVPQMQETNFANTTISYYIKGELLGMLLDLKIRELTGGTKSLDDVMRWMYKKFYDAPPATYYLPGRGYTEQDVLDALDQVSGSDLTRFFHRYVQGVAPLPYAQILDAAGLRLDVRVDPGSPPSLGILDEPAATGLRVTSVQPGRPADRAGISRDDVLISIDQLSLVTQQLPDLLRMYPPGSVVPFEVERLGQRLTIEVKLGPPIPNDYRIEAVPDAAPAAVHIRQGWLRTQESAVALPLSLSSRLRATPARRRESNSNGTGGGLVGER